MREITYIEAISEALHEELSRDEKVFIMGEDIGIYGGCFGATKGLIEKFGPERVLETPISESSFVGASVGAAIMGMRPVTELMFSDFVTLAVDQLANHAAKMRFMTGGQVKMPLVLRTPAGSGTGAAAQHSQCLEAWFTHVPGLKVVMPSTPHDAKGLLKSAIRDDNPVVFFEHKLLYKTKGMVSEEEYTIPLGQADIKHTGDDVTIVTYSLMLQKSLQAAQQLAKEGIHVEVIDLRTLMPLDMETIINSVKKTSRLVIVHEACKTGGLGGEISSQIVESEAFYYLDAPIKRVAGMDIPIPYTPELEKQVVPTEQSIYQAVKEVMA
jgi:acetoin:2,6-dichlorophenolindophenol oxidoreductase subunit beta